MLGDMVRRKTVVGAIVVAPWSLIVSGCSGARSRNADLEEARARWVAARPDRYRYEVRLSGFLPANRYRVDDAGPNRRGTVTVLEGSDPGDTSAWDTIDALFDTALRIRGEGGTATLTFAGGGPVPASLVTDPIPAAIDDEVEYKISGFEAY